MSTTAAQTAEPADRALEDLTAEPPPGQKVGVGCPQWCTNGPHEDAYERVVHDGEVTVVHEVYLLDQDGAEVVLEQLAHVSSSLEANRPMPPSLYVRIDEEIDSAETASRLGRALFEAARLMAQVAEPGVATS